MAKKEKTEKRVVNEQPEKVIHKYSIDELADLLGVSYSTIRNMYMVRGLDIKEKLSYDEAIKKLG